MYLYQCLLWTVSQNISILGKFPEKCGWQVLRCRQLGSGSRRENSTQNVFSLILICLVLNTINFVHDLSNIAKKKKQIFKRFLCQKFCRLVSGFTQKRPALTGSVSTTLVSTYVVHTSQLVNNTWCLSIVFDSLDCTACHWL